MRLMIATAAFACGLALLAGQARAQDETPSAPQTPREWRAAAEADLEAMRMYLREDTPVAVDSENPRIQRWFDRGYRDARGRLRRVRDHASYFYALAPYANGFQDPHLRLNPQPPLQIARWPGFIATAAGDGAVVHYRDEADDNAPQLGARIVSCDGRALAVLRERTVYPYTLNPQLAGDRRAATPRLFLDRGNVFAPPPRRCVFEEEGVRRTRSLRWRDLPEGDAYWTQYNLAAMGPPSSFGVSAPAEGVTWIGVPSFGNNEGDALRALVDEIAANAETIRNGRAIIIDVRGNGGGNSAWGDEIARAIFGAELVDAIPDPDPYVATDWAASPRNLDYINEFAPELIEQFGADSEIGQWVRVVQEGLAEAIARGEPLWRLSEASDVSAIPVGGGYTRRRPRGASPFPAHVYMLSNGACGSACLDFADIVLQIPGTTLIGEDTSGDGLLMEIRTQTLPSGQSRLSLPLKVYRGRARGALEAYAADIRYEGVWTDDAVRGWALDLAARQ